VLRVNHAGRRGFPGFDGSHRGKPLSGYDHAFVTADLTWPGWQQAVPPEGWPNIDVLQIESVPGFAGNAMSTDATLPGSLGWLAAHLAQWQVRILVLQTEPGKLAELRVFAAGLVARGGPAVVVEAFRAAQRSVFYRAFYRELIHDFPIDWMWQAALKNSAAGGRGTLYAGASREEQLRVSRIARHIPASTATTPVKRRPVRLILGLGGGGPLPLSLPGDPYIEKPDRAPPRPTAKKASPTLHLFGLGVKSSAAESWNFSHESTFLKVAKEVSMLRGPTRRVIDMDQALLAYKAAQKPPHRRYCNSSFWQQSENGSLQAVDQIKGDFRAGEIYQLAIHIGAKDLHIITANELR
jgi:hypothetical protein